MIGKLREIRVQEKMIDYWLIVLSLHLIFLLTTTTKMARWSQIRSASLPGQSSEYGQIQKSKGEAFDFPPISCCLKFPACEYVTFQPWKFSCQENSYLCSHTIRKAQSQVYLLEHLYSWPLLNNVS